MRIHSSTRRSRSFERRALDTRGPSVTQVISQVPGKRSLNFLLLNTLVRATLVAASILLATALGRPGDAQTLSHGSSVPTSPPAPQPYRLPTPPRHAAVRPHPKAIATHAPRQTAARQHPNAMSLTGDSRIEAGWRCNSSDGKSVLRFSADGTLQSSDGSTGTWASIGDTTFQVIFSGVDDTYFADLSGDSNTLILSTVSKTGVSKCSRM